MTRTACLALAGLLFVAGCGVEGDPVPPEGEEALYTYPLPYPDPKTVVPGGREEDRAGSRLQPRGTPLIDDPLAPTTRTIEPVE